MIEEIRKRIKERKSNVYHAGDYDEYADGIVVGLSYALGIIDDIEKEHPAPSDVQEAAEKWAATTHFEWPNQVPAGKKGFAAGMLAERERLMAGAIKTNVFDVEDGTDAAKLIVRIPGAKTGDEVYIIKEEGK